MWREDYVLLVASSAHSDIYLTGGAVVRPHSTFEKLISFVRLEKGWYYGSGGPISINQIFRAIRYFNILKTNGFEDIDAAPGVDGEILLSAEMGSGYIEVILETDLSVSIAYDRDGVQQFYVSHKLPDEADMVIKDVARGIWSASGGFIQSTSIISRVVSPVLHTGIQAVTQGCPLLTAVVFNPEVAQSAIMPDSIIGRSLPSRQYFGNLIP
jgi:hypothetical protein